MRVLGGLWLVFMLLGGTGCGPKTMDQRLKDAERLADKATAAMDEAEKAGAALEPRKMESALDDAKGFLTEKDSELYPEAAMNMDRYKELAARLPQVKAAREKRDLDERLNKARDKIVPRVQAMLEAQEALVLTAPTKAKCEDLEDRARSVKEAVDDDLDLFVKDADFAAWARSQRSKVDKATEHAARGRRGVAFLEGPVEAWKESLTLMKQMRATKGLVEKQKVFSDARAKLAICMKDSKPFDADKTVTTLAFVMPEGKPQTPGQLGATCDKTFTTTDMDWKKLGVAVTRAQAKAKQKPKKKK